MKMKKVNYNEISSKYDNRYNEDQWSNIKEKLLETISLNEYNNILEVGCGTGYWLNAIKALNVNCFGLDYSIGMLKEAKSKKRCGNLINGDANALPFKNNKFDFIFCMNALHHFSLYRRLQNPKSSFLRELECET